MAGSGVNERKVLCCFVIYTCGQTKCNAMNALVTKYGTAAQKKRA